MAVPEDVRWATKADESLKPWNERDEAFFCPALREEADASAADNPARKPRKKPYLAPKKRGRKKSPPVDGASPNEQGIEM